MSYNCKEDFLGRTIKIVEEYQQDKKDTLLINCMLGLLVFIKETHPDKILSANYISWGIEEKDISTCLGEKEKQFVESKDIKDVIRHLRNSVSHCHFEMINDGKNEITHIEFWDYPYGDENEPENFHAKIPVNDLKPFLLNFANSILTIIK